MSSPYPESRQSGSGRWVIIALVLLVALPITFRSCDGETDRWKVASIMESWLDGEKQESIERLTEISKRLPEDYRVKLVLAEWLLEDEKPEEALAIVREIPETWRDARSENLIRDCLLATGQPKLALLEYRRRYSGVEGRSRAEQLAHQNALAYYQALAREDLIQAEKKIRDVLDATREDFNKKIPMEIDVQTVFCVARVFQHQMKVEKISADKKATYVGSAVDELTKMIDYMQAKYEGVQGPSTQLENDTSMEEATPANPDQASQKESAESRVGSREEVGRNEKEWSQQRIDEYAQAMAALLSLRAMIYQDTNQNEASFADRRAVLELGIDPEETIKMFPSFQESIHRLNLMATYLDTCGCVLLKLKKVREARAFLGYAVMAQNALVEVAEYAPRTRFEISMDPRQQYRDFVRAQQRTLAVLLLHRSWTHSANGDQESYQKDRERIRALGFRGRFLF